MTEILRNMTILITGSNGFIGKNLCRELQLSGANIIAILHRNNDLDLPIEKIYYDGTYESLYLPLQSKKIDVVVHLATCFLPNHKEAQITDLIDANIKLGTHLLELTKQKGISAFINTSTYAQNSKHQGYDPQNLYAATKQAFEVIMKYYEETSQTKFVTLELTDTYGPGDSRPKFINLILNAISKDVVFNMSLGEQEICYLYIDDAVNAFKTCIEHLYNAVITENSKFSVYSDEVFKLKDLVVEVCDTLNVTLEINPGFYPYRFREIMTYQPSYIKLPGWKCVNSIKDGLKKMKKNAYEN
ncbi:MAG: NAD(P)-dependent oxidoreductase [Paludibacter sp.]